MRHHLFERTETLRATASTAVVVRRLRAARPAGLTLLLLIFLTAVAPPLAAGDWHYGASAVCSDCHTQHNSEGGQPMRTDNNPTAAPKLLRRGTPLELCLSCHDGGNPHAPDVIAPVSYVADPAGGALASGGTPSMMAHNLDSATAEVPPGGTIPMRLVCTTCHDPHGNANYRNLREDPTRSNQPPVSVLSYQATMANGTNPSSVYVPTNVIYKSGVSAWCGKCHGEPLEGSDHPDDKPIFGSLKASYPTWVAVTLPRIPVHSPVDNVVPSTDDRVMCLSCHKAHGSQNEKTLIYADGLTLDSTCQECHDQ